MSDSVRIPRAAKAPTRKPATRAVASFIHWPIVALAAMPCLAFVAIVIALLAMMPGAKPAPARAAAELAPITAVVKPASVVPPGDTFDAEIKIPAHHAMAAIGDLPVFDIPETPAPAIQPILPRNDLVPVKPEKEKDGCFGTAVNFLGTPAEAFSAARKEKRLTFILHVSGNFEDSGFT